MMWQNFQKRKPPLIFRLKVVNNRQEPISRSMQLHYIPVTAFSYTDLSLDRTTPEWDSRGSAMTNHKKLTDVTASLDRNCLSFSKEKMY